MTQALNASHLHSGSQLALVWIHIGDLHLTDPELSNHLALQEISSVVKATDNSGQVDQDQIEVAAFNAIAKPVFADGSDCGFIGAWPEKHISGTQLGPNSYGQKW